MGMVCAPEYSTTRLFVRPFLPLIYLVAYLFSCSLHTMVVHTGKRVYSSLFEMDLFQTSGDRFVVCNNLQQHANLLLFMFIIRAGQCFRQKTVGKIMRGYAWKVCR